MALTIVVTALLLVNSAFAFVTFDHLCVDEHWLGGVHPHPTECHQFIECANGIGFEMDCPVGLAYNDAIKACDDPIKMNCYPGGATQPPTTNPLTKKPIHILNHLCVDEHWKAGVHPHPTECHQFIECANGIAYEMDCPSGLAFNPSLGVCDDPVKMNCYTGGATPPPTTPAPITRKPIHTLNHLCVDQHWKAGVHPHPTECHQFIECANGIAYEMDCPSGLAFNPSLGVCDDPVKMNCYTGGATPPLTTPAPITGKPIHTLNHLCVDKHWKAGVHPHPTECHQFIECANGIAYEMDCPSGLAFNPSLGVCDDPVKMNCYTGGATPPLTTPAPITGKPIHTLNHLCVDKHWKAGVHPHPTECHQFIECANGIAYEMDCPSGLAFNPSLGVCDDPVKMNCYTGGATPPPTTPAPITGKPIHSLNHLCVDKHWKAGVHPHPTECHQFIECANGIAYEMDCPSGLAFNPSLGVCDDPVKMNCYTGGATPPPTTPAPITGKPIHSLNHLCVDKHWKAGVHPHPTECHQFIECANGIAYEMDCPSGLAFNPSLGVCDDPVKMNCYTGGATPPPTIPPPTTAAPMTRKPIHTLNHLCVDEHWAAGLHPHPTHCHQFIECANGIAYEMDCPVGLAYNHALLACDDPVKMKCFTHQKAAVPLNQVPKTVHKAPVTLDHLCVDQHWQAGVHPHPTDCHKFVECANGIAYQMSCAGGLAFNPSIMTCDSADKMNCQTGGGTGKSGNRNHLCVDKHWAAGIHPHPTDCHRFIECSNGLAYDMACAAGLAFNPSIKGCDNADKMNCKTNTGNGTSGDINDLCKDQGLTDGIHTHPFECHKFIECGNSITYILACPSNLVFDSSAKTCKPAADVPSCKTSGGNKTETTPPSTINAKSVCGDFGLATGIHPHPDKCDSYIQCNGPTTYEMKCPPGLLYDRKAKDCDQIYKVDCQDNIDFFKKLVIG